ncbi:hypothetical protein [Gilliamella sp. B2973]|uniref:hypothetical protein n=1 Tax=Gilliamella sp. B2973 TaxID=2817986 RepID=UPI002269ED49|nr:hypothetical protein [Gilliamella sp. B2973]
MALFLPFSGHALTSQTTRNAIQGSAPYLTFDGGRTRAVDANGLLGITLSNGIKYTPSTNTSSSSAPIALPAAGQSFADIRMFVPTDTNSVDLSTLIGPPNNYWGDDDGDSGVSATGRLSLSIVDKNNQAVSRSTVPEICKAPYRVTLSSTGGTLSTRYGVPNSRSFNESSVTYFLNPKATPVVCFARPSLSLGSYPYSGLSRIWDQNNGFLPQSTDPSRYASNFPTTGANGLYFDLLIGGGNQALSWSPVSQGEITVTMSNSTSTSVRVTLTGPFATESQHDSANPGRISIPTLPQTFELVGQDSQGNPVVKYGFTIKRWFVNRGYGDRSYDSMRSWCRSLGYGMPMVRDLTNASCPNSVSETLCHNSVGARPRSRDNYYQRYIGAGFFTEWGDMTRYYAGFNKSYFWTSDEYGSGGRFPYFFVVRITDGRVARMTTDSYYSHASGLCIR